MTQPGNDYEEAEAHGLGYMRHCLIQSCAIDDVRVNDSMLKVLVALGSYASKKNSHWCWMTQSTIANRLGVTRQLVSRAANALQACGYIEIREAFRRDGGQISSSYRLLLDYELPADYRRSEQPRRRAGIGGRRKGGGSNSEFTPPATNRVAPPATNRVAPLNTESESGDRKEEKEKPSFSLEIKSGRNEERPHVPFVAPIAEMHGAAPATPPPPLPGTPTPAVGTWLTIRNEVAISMSPTQRREWLDRLEFFRVAPTLFALVAPTAYAAEVIETRWGGHFRAALHAAAGPLAELTIVGVPAKKKVVSA
ncbi:MAG TPA: helix-turn-helix domain-containing protein [Ktedonobacterales bacterium]|nr:helix-turn-helix domain-containing protein [Ktedonobacterales bacterium]